MFQKRQNTNCYNYNIISDPTIKQTCFGLDEIECYELIKLYL